MLAYNLSRFLESVFNLVHANDTPDPLLTQNAPLELDIDSIYKVAFDRKTQQPVPGRSWFIMFYA